MPFEDKIRLPLMTEKRAIAMGIAACDYVADEYRMREWRMASRELRRLLVVARRREGTQPDARPS